MLNEIELSQKLIQVPSYSGDNPQVINFLQDYLTNLGFSCDILEYDGDGSYKVNNLHAVYNPNNSKRVFYFAGHTDVVLPGDVSLWSHNPFAADIVEDKLIGRGAADMKCAIAAFIVATQEFIATQKSDFGIGFLITNDEENDSVNGTKKVLDWMHDNNHKISACIVGEPTNPEAIGEMIKIGRRGSVSFNIKIIGEQGHVAYPQKARNPITTLINLLKILKDHKFDDGNEFFDPTNLEITSINSDNFGGNVIPMYAQANINVRFNSQHSAANIIDLVEYVCKKTASGLGTSYELTHRTSGESFLSKPEKLAEIASQAIEKICQRKPVLSTSGGTSDARFIKDYCPEVIEFGLINKTAHHIDEFAYLQDITALKNTYLEILKKF